MSVDRDARRRRPSDRPAPLAASLEQSELGPGERGSAGTRVTALAVGEHADGNRPLAPTRHGLRGRRSSPRRRRVPPRCPPARVRPGSSPRPGSSSGRSGRRCRRSSWRPRATRSPWRRFALRVRRAPSGRSGCVPGSMRTTVSPSRVRHPDGSLGRRSRRPERTAVGSSRRRDASAGRRARAVRPSASPTTQRDPMACSEPVHRLVGTREVRPVRRYGNLLLRASSLEIFAESAELVPRWVGEPDRAVAGGDAERADAVCRRRASRRTEPRRSSDREQ